MAFARSSNVRRSTSLIRLLLISVCALILISLGVLQSFVWVLKEESNECQMTYMFPNYIRLSMKNESSSNKYSLYLYKEGHQHSSVANSPKQVQVRCIQVIILIQSSCLSASLIYQLSLQKLLASLNGAPVLFIPGNAGKYYKYLSSFFF